MPIGTTAALLGSAGIQGVTSLLGGILGKKSATSAADIQAKAAAAAGKKLEDAAATVNPQITAAAEYAAGGASDVAHSAGQDVRNIGYKGVERVDEATAAANAKLDPYSATGEKATNLLATQLDSAGKMPTLADLQIDPGYAYRSSEEQKAILANAASRGAASGGGVLKALSKYQGAEASQEYQNAFERFRQSNNDRFSQLSSAAAAGQSAAGAQGANLIGSGKYGSDVGVDAAKFAGNLDYNANTYGGDKNYGAAVKAGDNTIEAAHGAADYLTQGANAQAAGKVGGTNALFNGINGGAGALAGGISLAELLKNPGNLFAKGAKSKLDIMNAISGAPGIR